MEATGLLLLGLTFLGQMLLEGILTGILEGLFDALAHLFRWAFGINQPSVQKPSSISTDNVSKTKGDYAFGYFLVSIGMGFIAGILSLWIQPNLLIQFKIAQYLNFAFTPLLVGWGMALLGLIRQRNGKHRLKLETFVHGFAFAMALTATRFFLATPAS